MGTVSGQFGAYSYLGWEVTTNVWNPGSLIYGTDYTAQIQYVDGDPTSGVVASWSFPDSPPAPLDVHAFPELAYGPSPWSGGTDSTEVMHPFPIQVDSINSLYLNYNVSIGGDTAGYNVAFEVWLTNQPDGGPASATNEIMVWIHQGAFTPAGDVVGTYNSPHLSGTIYYYPGPPGDSGASLGNWKYTALLSDGDNLDGQIDLLSILKSLEGLGIISGQNYVADVELGAEVAAGQGSLTINNFNFNLNGAGDYMSMWNAASFPGSVAGDTIYLYSNQNTAALTAAAAGQPVNQPQTFDTFISITIDGTIINGQAPTVHFYPNGIDEGVHTLQPTASAYTDGQGVIWSVPQTFTFSLSGLVKIDELKVNIDSAVNAGGVENVSTYISSVSVDGVALTQGTYYPLDSAPQQASLTDLGQWDGGYEIIDASPWNTQLASRDIGTASNPIQVSGGGGTDTVHVLGVPSEYTVQGIGTSTIALSESSGLDQNSVLTDISYLAFQDGSILDLLNGIWSAGSQPLIAAPAVAVEASMYNAVGSSAEVASLMANFLPAQETNAANYGLNPLVYGCEALGLAFAFGNENGSTTFAANFGPSNASMPNTTAGDAAFAAAASTTIFESASTQNLVNVLENFVANWKSFYSGSGIPGIPNPTADQIDLAARAASWGDMVGVALANNLGPLSAEVNNFLNDVVFGTAHYSASLTSEPAAPIVAMVGLSSQPDAHLL
jgi:hypothetical protein